jgi:predicted TIM-barrel fold metal-dependent hydrolase
MNAVKLHPLPAAILFVSLAATASALAQSPIPDASVDPTLAATLASVPAIDNHAHPMLSPPAMDADRNFDALPVDTMEPYSDPAGLKPALPALTDAWHALYNFNEPSPLDVPGQRRLDALRAQVRAQQGEGYSAWVLDQANIGTMFANRVAMGTGVQPPRFRWVPYIDALLFPLDNSALAGETPDRSQFFPLEDKVRARYMEQAGLKVLPLTLDSYLKQLVTPILEQQRANGAVAEKFELAYLRSFDISDPSKQEAAAIYARFRGRAHPADPDFKPQYKLLQDYLFRTIAAECGRLGLPVHLHTISGAGGYFSIAGANPLLLEPLFNDPRLRKTTFVLIHGGWPFVHEIGALLQKPNVFLDLSQQSLMFPPRTMSIWLREWLELTPEKVLYGTDAYPYSPAMGWEEAAWIANRNIRTSLGIALTGMIDDREVTPPRASQIARMVLRANAEQLYRLRATE